MKITAQPSDSNIMQSIIDVIGFILFFVVQIARSIYQAVLPRSYRSLKDVQGEIALVTGGGGGLGRLLALRLAKLGATVVLWDVNTQGLEETVGLVKGIGGKVYAFKCDLANREDVYKIAKKTQEEVGDITILINNAGVASGYLLLDTPDHLIQRTFDVNVVAHFWTVKAFLPKMIQKNHGHIVTIASMAGHTGVSKLVDYCSSKFAAVGFDEALRIELESQGIKGVKTTVICPYFIQQTGMFDDVKSKFLPTLKSNDVADRIVEAIRRDEEIVMIPGHFKLAMIFKAMVPWSVTSVVLRQLLPDAAPQHQSEPVVQIKEKQEEEEKIQSSERPNSAKMGSLSTSVKLNQRLTAAGKNL
uniref:Short-chain dehydrogenase/reductase family 16C member 6 n=1 Tax=Anoplophora glabripennis TaxID=217634 RepID=V5GTC3_ANOGL